MIDRDYYNFAELRTQRPNTSTNPWKLYSVLSSSSSTKRPVYFLYLQYPAVITSKDSLAPSKYSLASGSGKTTYKL